MKCEKCGEWTGGTWYDGHKWPYCDECLEKYFYEEDLYNSMLHERELLERD